MARYLVQSKIAAELRQGQPLPPGTPKPLDPGHMRLYSFYRPSLQAARYAIETTQTVTVVGGDGKSSTIKRYNSQLATDVSGNNTGNVVQQEFEVVAPQFNLDPKLVNTYYPPDGHSDEGQILPHVVFNDPHVPWFRPAGIKSWMTSAVDVSSFNTTESNEKDGHNFMPWLALLVFQPEELLVTPDEANLLGLTADGMKVYDPLKLPGNGVYQMTVGHYISSLKSRVYYEAAYNKKDAAVSVTDIQKPGHVVTSNSPEAEFKTLMDSTEVTRAIFPTKAQVKAVFEDKNGGLAPLEAQRLLSHVRQINTVGFPDAGVEEEGYFSVVVSSMTGNIRESLPSTHIVHLVSLEHIDSTLTDAKSSLFGTDNSDRIGLVSLMSWTYTCIPESINFKDRMIALAKGAQPLQPPREVLKATQPPASTAAQDLLYQRLSAGYTIARWRAPTGEESVAFNRGPLVPAQVQEVPKPHTPPTNPGRSWPALSMTGKDYAVFDQRTGMMDLTYSAAWSLGRVEAIADSIFNAALMRFRSSIWKNATSAARMFIAGIIPQKEQVSQSAAAAKNAAVIIHNFKGSVSRVNKSSDLHVPPSMDDPSVSKVFREAIDNAVNYCASAINSSGTSIMYNGFDSSQGNNSDWEIILNWVHDVMYLASIPAHVLFPEPSHLHSQGVESVPDGRSKLVPEVLRFFHIDHAWIDCFLDGALSVANHLEPEFDYTRLRIKAVLNNYLGTSIGNTSIKPPVPRYGFIIRSAVVKATPDLRLSVRAWTSATKDGSVTWSDRDCLVRHTKMDETTIFSLVDCLPEEIKSITMSQPPHQQRFAIPYDVELGRPTVSFKQLYTDPGQVPKDGASEQTARWPLFSVDPDVSTQKNFYTDSTRCIDPVKITQSAIDQLKGWSDDLVTSGKSTTKPYDDNVPNSCVLGLELNDPAYELQINGPNQSAPSKPFDSWTRVIWLGDHVPSPYKPRSIRPSSSDIKKSKLPAEGSGTAIIKNGPVNPGVTIDTSAAVPNGLPRVTHKTSQHIPKQNIAYLKFEDRGTPNFELIIYPDYRVVPPRPIPATANQGMTFSPLYNLPTNTAFLYDLIFAIRRRDPTARGVPPLQSITIEVPVATNSTQFEALLDGTDYSETGVTMIRNLRFVPTLYSGTASPYSTNLGWDGSTVLGITLVPKSSRTTGTISMSNDPNESAKTMDISFRITRPRVTPVSRPTPCVIATLNNSGKPAGSIQKLGKTYVRMTEHYSDGKTDTWRWSWCVVLKKDLNPTELAKEVDQKGRPVGVLS